jgi:hypothetical protein
MVYGGSIPPHPLSIININLTQVKMEAISILKAAFKELGLETNLLMHTTMAVDAIDEINYMLGDESEFGGSVVGQTKREWICEYAENVAYKIYIWKL